MRKVPQCRALGQRRRQDAHLRQKLSPPFRSEPARLGDEVGSTSASDSGRASGLRAPTRVRDVCRNRKDRRMQADERTYGIAALEDVAGMTGREMMQAIID